jgi:hypothetical protein
MSCSRLLRRAPRLVTSLLFLSLLLSAGHLIPAAQAAGVDTTGSATTAPDLTDLHWVAKQEPTPGRISTLSSATALGAENVTGRILRFELRPGELYTGDGHATSRAEVYGRIPSDRTTPASGWQDPPGSERWYDFRVFFPSSFPVATDTRWLTFTQWKGLRGGVPPISLEVKRSGLRVGGSRTNAGKLPSSGAIGPLTPGRWTRLTVGIRWSTTAATGWVQVYRDGALAMPKTHVATMDVVGGTADPVYTKQGLYRSSVWTSTHKLYFAPLTVSSTRPTS